MLFRSLTDISFTVSEGEVVGLIGPNGAGKTTVFNVITGVYKASSGKVTYDDKILTGLRPYQVLTMGIARTFQNIRLFQNMTALENCMVAQHSRSKAGVWGAILRSPSQQREEKRIQEKSQKALDFMGLGDKTDEIACNLPYGYQIGRAHV